MPIKYRLVGEFHAMYLVTKHKSMFGGFEYHRVNLNSIVNFETFFYTVYSRELV